ncbi:MAG: Crp/Fnr family transcriptional regulator [Desulfobulbaceae bacterium]|nr:MAG: Crp/Fnr family transcriptional regulator [Desulfobulbaceae bacterium]
MTKKEIIDSCSLFAGLPEKQVQYIAELTIEKKFGKGEAIFFEGDQADGFYIVKEGTVKVYKMNMLGKEQILHIFNNPEIIGEVAVFHGKPFPANAQTLTNSSLLYFPRSDFIRLIESSPSLALNMLAILSARLRQFARQIEELSLKEVPARLAGYLIYLTEEQGNAIEVTLPVSKGQLASLLGTIPETLSRIFTKLTDEGLIQVSGKTIKIVDRDKLTDKVQS